MFGLSRRCTLALFTLAVLQPGVPALADDVRRARIVREEIGPDRRLMMDANQVWEVGDAIANMKLLAEYQ